jgi:hypothetical protein
MPKRTRSKSKSRQNNLRRQALSTGDGEGGGGGASTLERQRQQGGKIHHVPAEAAATTTPTGTQSKLQRGTTIVVPSVSSMIASMPPTVVRGGSISSNDSEQDYMYTIPTTASSAYPCISNSIPSRLHYNSHGKPALRLLGIWFSDEETNAIRSALWRYGEVHSNAAGGARDILLFLLGQKNNAKGAVRRYTGAWDWIAKEACPDRAIISVYRHAIRKLGPELGLYRNDAWSSDEISNLFRLYKIHGAQWVKLQTMLNRSHHMCERMYNHYHLSSGRFTDFRREGEEEDSSSSDVERSARRMPTSYTVAQIAEFLKTIGQVLSIPSSVLAPLQLPPPAILSASTTRMDAHSFHNWNNWLVRQKEMQIRRSSEDGQNSSTTVVTLVEYLQTLHHYVYTIKKQFIPFKAVSMRLLHQQRQHSNPSSSPASAFTGASQNLLLNDALHSRYKSLLKTCERVRKEKTVTVSNISRPKRVRRKRKKKTVTVANMSLQKKLELRQLKRREARRSKDQSSGSDGSSSSSSSTGSSSSSSSSSNRSNTRRIKNGSNKNKTTNTSNVISNIHRMDQQEKDTTGMGDSSSSDSDRNSSSSSSSNSSSSSSSDSDGDGDGAGDRPSSPHKAGKSSAASSPSPFAHDKGKQALPKNNSGKKKKNQNDNLTRNDPQQQQRQQQQQQQPNMVKKVHRETSELTPEKLRVVSSSLAWPFATMPNAGNNKNKTTNTSNVISNIHRMDQQEKDTTGMGDSSSSDSDRNSSSSNSSSSSSSDSDGDGDSAGDRPSSPHKAGKSSAASSPSPFAHDKGKQALPKNNSGKKKKNQNDNLTRNDPQQQQPNMVKKVHRETSELTPEKLRVVASSLAWPFATMPHATSTLSEAVAPPATAPAIVRVPKEKHNTTRQPKRKRQRRNSNDTSNSNTNNETHAQMQTQIQNQHQHTKHLANNRMTTGSSKSPIVQQPQRHTMTKDKKKGTHAKNSTSARTSSNAHGTNPKPLPPLKQNQKQSRRPTKTGTINSSQNTKVKKSKAAANAHANDWPFA